jgi:hypothetical protein
MVVLGSESGFEPSAGARAGLQTSQPSKVYIGPLGWYFSAQRWHFASCARHGLKALAISLDRIFHHLPRQGTVRNRRGSGLITSVSTAPG